MLGTRGRLVIPRRYRGRHLDSNRLELLEDRNPGERSHGVLVSYWLKAFFIPETGQPCYRVGPVVPVVLQAVLQTFGGTDGWDRWDRHDCRSTRSASPCTPVPPVPPGGTTYSHQNPVQYHRYHRSHRRNGPRGLIEDGIAHHDDASWGPVPAASSSILGSST